MFVASLPDIQNITDQRGISLQKVGIRNVDVPFTVVTQEMKQQNVQAKVSLSVMLQADKKGTHMSRFIEALEEWRHTEFTCFHLKDLCEILAEKLDTVETEVDLHFKYFIEKPAPVSKKIAVMGYDCSFKNSLKEGRHIFQLGVKVPVKALCPCSKEISKYGAHNQRTMIDLKITYHHDQMIWIEDLIKLCENASSCPVFPLLKREDEKYVTEKAYENPKFVEDIIRDVILQVKELQITSYAIQVEAFESIHDHNAFAAHSEQMS